MKLKKIVSVLLVGAMAAALLAGCGGSSEEEGAETTATEGAASAEAEAAESFEGFDETQNITMYGMSFFGDGGLEEVLAAINEISESEINVHVDYTPMDVATYMEQIGLMLSGGEPFDLTLCTAIPVVSFSTMQAQNELMDISEELYEYAPELMELMADYIPATTVDGAIYAVPCYRIYNSSYYILMRQDILDELGLTEQARAIDSWSDFEEIMAAVQAAQDTLPEEMQTNCVLANSDAQGNVITGMYVDMGPDDFADCYGYETLADTLKLIQVDEETNTVINHFTTDTYKESLERVNKWYSEGYIYKDAATTDDTGDTQIKNGIAFANVGLCEYGCEVTKTAEIGYPMVAVEIVKAPISTSSGNQWAWAVPTTSENPEAAVAFLNLMYTNADIENLFVYGIEGRDYELNEEGEACVLEDHLYQCSDFFFGNQFNAYPAEGNGGDFRELALADMNEAEISKYYGCVINTNEISNELTALSTALAKYEAGLESGTTDVSNLDTMLSELESSGAQTVLDYYQAGLDNWLAEQ